MRKASVSETKSKLSSLLAAVKRGETILISDRGKPVARLEPVSHAFAGESSHVEALIRSGVASAPRQKLDVAAFLSRGKARIQKGTSAVSALVEERNRSL